MKSVRDADVHGKVVFLRCDFNVPMKDGKIEDDNRIRAALPTIQYLQEKKAKIVIGTHLGRPKMPEYEAEFSTLPAAQRLSEILGQKVLATDFVKGKEVKDQVDQLKPGEILLLGNLRFDKGEELNDEGFAHELASLAEIYVNDAFAVSHRANASVEAIAKFLPSYSGFLLESEITTLSFLLDNPEHPFILIIGGVKAEDKAGLLKNLESKADKVLIGGAVANTFLKAKGENISQSLYDTEMVDQCKDMLMNFGDKIILPVDSVNEDLGNGEFKMLDIGPKTVQNFVHEINNSASIFWNGNMGYTEDEKYAEGTKAVAEAMKNNQNTTVVAGGDTAGYVISHGYKENISFISTGGGAAMEFLSGIKLPGIEALEKNQN